VSINIFNKKILFFILVAIGLLQLSCVYASYQAVDDLGKTITLPKKPKKIITLSPNSTEILFAIGAGKTIVGTVDQADYPLAAKKIKRIGSYPAPDFESIIALSPDLVVLPKQGLSYAVVAELEKFKLPYFVLNPRTLADIANDILQLGKITGNEKKALQISTVYQNKIRQLKKQYQKRNKVTVFYELWNPPLMTINNKTLINEMIELCGGQNIFGTIKIQYPTINIASVIAKNPQVIIVSNKKQSDEWSKWPNINAVKNNKVFYLSPDLAQRTSPRIIAALINMCKIINGARST
jgi:iron complex transport system substrate-binding protein